MSERVSIEIKDGIADVRLNRPEKMNAIDAAMFNGLVAAGRELAEDTSVRAVVLSGEGRAFCAGLDFSSFQAMQGSRRDENIESAFDRDGASPANAGQRAAFIWQELPMPVIAAVHGAAFGGGLQIALGADIRYVRPDAQLSVMEIKWGLVPDMSGTQTLRHLTSLDVVKELAFTGKIINGEEAVELGLATRVAENPHEEAMTTAREIASKSPDAIRALKRLLNDSVQSTLADGLGLEAKLQASLIGRPNQTEAVKANLANRDPNFKDPS